MKIDEKLAHSLEMCGFITGEKQESRLLSVLETVLKLQQDPPIPLTFSDIYEKLQKEDPSKKLSKAWIHRVLKQLLETKLVRVDNPAAYRKKYIADVNTIMNGFEELKSQKIGELESERAEIDKALEEIATLDCGQLSKELVASITGRQEELSSRIVKGVEELHRVLRFNMLEKAGEGDIIRATLLWAGPFINDEMRNRMLRFIEAAENGAEIRYLVSSDIFKLEENEEVSNILQGMFELTVSLRELRKRGKKFSVRIYSGPKTYNQVSFNQESMALVIAENPVTATWITRKFNPDLIDNAVKTFDNDWKKAKSLENLTQEDFNTFGAQSEGLVKRALSEFSKEK